MDKTETDRIKKLESEITKIEIYGLILAAILFILFIDFIRSSIFTS
jgi:hypothetical protein